MPQAPTHMHPFLFLIFFLYFSLRVRASAVWSPAECSSQIYLSSDTGPCFSGPQRSKPPHYLPSVSHNYWVPEFPICFPLCLKYFSFRYWHPRPHLNITKKWVVQKAEEISGQWNPQCLQPGLILKPWLLIRKSTLMSNTYFYTCISGGAWTLRTQIFLEKSLKILP